LIGFGLLCGGRWWNVCSLGRVALRRSEEFRSMRILLTARILFYRRFGIFRADSCCLLGAHNSLSVRVFELVSCDWLFSYHLVGESSSLVFSVLFLLSR
jgi:hypothetical protein